VEDIVRSFHNDAWLPCANGYWLDVHEHEELNYAWGRFVREVKHERRYFFSVSEPQETFTPSEKYSSADLLVRIGELVTNLGLTRKLAKGSRYYRARQTPAEGKALSSFSDLGPPPEDVAGAGRMNPGGISYLYLAFESDTAVAEVVPKGGNATVGQFELRQEVTVLDLSVQPQLPSVFDAASRSAREESMFLRAFARAISQPVDKDGREHIEYVPSQIVSEYLAQVFRTKEGSRLAGIIYPSTAQANGLNLVLFPGVSNESEWDEALTLVDVKRV
jgi:RES domain-containing protein